MKEVFLDIEAEAGSLDTARAVVLPVPYEGSVTYGTGTAQAPRAIIEASGQVELWDPRLGLDYGALSIATHPEVRPTDEGPEAMTRRVHDVVDGLLGEGTWVAMLGGEHSITVGAVEAHLKHFPGLGVLQIDAHADLRDSYQGSRYNHACVMRRVRERCSRTVQVAIRSLSREEHDFIEQHDVPVFWGWELEGTSWMDDVLAQLPPQVYITLDADGLDPSLLPGTGTPEPGGLTWNQTLGLLERVARQRQVVGFDLVEVAPVQGSNVSEFVAARLVAAIIGLVLDGQ